MLPCLLPLVFWGNTVPSAICSAQQSFVNKFVHYNAGSMAVMQFVSVIIAIADILDGQSCMPDAALLNRAAGVMLKPNFTTYEGMLLLAFKQNILLDHKLQWHIRDTDCIPASSLLQKVSSQSLPAARMMMISI